MRVYCTSPQSSHESALNTFVTIGHLSQVRESHACSDSIHMLYRLYTIDNNIVYVRVYIYIYVTYATLYTYM